MFKTITVIYFSDGSTFSTLLYCTAAIRVLMSEVEDRYGVDLC